MQSTKAVIILKKSLAVVGVLSAISLSFGSLYMNDEKSVQPQTSHYAPIKAIEVENEQATVYDEYNLSDIEMRELLATVKHESNRTYEGAAAVVQTLVNRMQSDEFPDDLMSVMKAPKQFDSYDSGHYQQFMNDVDDYVHQAVEDVLSGSYMAHTELYFYSDVYVRQLAKKGVYVDGNSIGGNTYHDGSVWSEYAWFFK